MNPEAALLLAPGGFQIYLIGHSARTPHPSGGIGPQYLIWAVNSADDLQELEQALRGYGRFIDTYTSGGVTFLAGRDPDGIRILMAHPARTSSPARSSAPTSTAERCRTRRRLPKLGNHRRRTWPMWPLTLRCIPPTDSSMWPRQRGSSGRCPRPFRAYAVAEGGALVPPSALVGGTSAERTRTATGPALARRADPRKRTADTWPEGTGPRGPDGAMRRRWTRRTALPGVRSRRNCDDGSRWPSRSHPEYVEHVVVEEALICAPLFLQFMLV